MIEHTQGDNGYKNIITLANEVAWETILSARRLCLNWQKERRIA